jgi:Skp family chaperone for outer membrane proteins
MSWIYYVHCRTLPRANGLLWTWVSAALIAISSCSTARPPTDILANAELGLRAADEARADELAPVDLKNAREKLARAKQAMAAEKYNEARRFAESAQVDAELAEAKAEAEIMRRAADQALRKGDAPATKAELESREPLSQGSPKE